LNMARVKRTFDEVRTTKRKKKLDKLFVN